MNVIRSILSSLSPQKTRPPAEGGNEEDELLSDPAAAFWNLDFMLSMDQEYPEEVLGGLSGLVKPLVDREPELARYLHVRTKIRWIRVNNTHLLTKLTVEALKDLEDLLDEVLLAYTEAGKVPEDVSEMLSSEGEDVLLKVSRRGVRLESGAVATRKFPVVPLCAGLS